MTVRLLARYRPIGDTHTDAVEQTVEAADYEAALAQARARAADGDLLLSVVVLD